MDIVIVGGENPVFIKEELDKTIQNFPESDRTVYYGDELQNEEFFVDLRTGSLFVARRIIIIRNADKASSDFEKLLLNYIQDPSNFVLLILEYGKIPTKVLNAAEKLGNKRIIIHNFKKAWASDLKRYAQRRLNDKGLTISTGALDLLVSFSGEDIEELSGMLTRLITYVGENLTQVDEKIIHHILERAQNASVFDLMDAIFSHNPAKALQSYQDLMFLGEGFPAIVAMFYRSAKIMWAVKVSKNGQIPQGFSVSPYEWKKYQAYARINNLRFVSQCFECIQKLEIESKTKGDIFTQTTFENFLIINL